MRLRTAAASLLSALALAGCGDDSDEPTWAGPPNPDADGNVTVDDFAAHQEEVDQAWERSPVTAAAEFLRLEERTTTRTTIEAEAGAEGMGPSNVTVTLDGLLDDSVRAERWTLVFEPEAGNGTYRLTTAQRTLRCQPGRGHQDFSPGSCV